MKPPFRHKRFLNLAAVSVLAASATAVAEQPANVPLAERIGITHVDGKYHLTAGDYLNEGADQILRTGTKVIKIYLENPRRFYPFNTDWGRINSMVEAARHPYYQALFEKPFQTYVMTTTSYVHPQKSYYRDGVSDEDYAEEARQFQELATYLLTTYRETGKTFILSHWEGDWHVRGSYRTEPEHDPTDAQFEGMVRWLNARQEGVSRARREVQGSTARVFHAPEVNLVKLALDGRPTVTNNVLPHTPCDLYSYSAYDTIGLAAEDPEQGRALFRRALEHLAAKAPPGEHFGRDNIFIGEFGWPEVRSGRDPQATTEKHLQVLRATVEVALDFGCPYLLYWQLYDNECTVPEGKASPDAEDCRGFWLIRPDGTRTAAWEYFTSLLSR